MKYKVLFIAVLALVCSQCKWYGVDYEYKNYKRVVGKEGGTIYFFANYHDDRTLLINDTSSYLLKMEVPSGALDTQVVFNFYQFQEFNLANDLSEGFANVGCQFFYFVPFLYSQGYHEHEGADLEYHETFSFKKPIKIKYYFADYLNPRTIDEWKLKYNFYDRVNETYSVYKIRIPAYGQWGETRNIFIEINKQGYPIGYNKNDLKDIILGYWQPFTTSEEINLNNWEKVDNYKLDLIEKSVSFDIENSDYMYVVARKLQIETSDLPSRIVNYVVSQGKTIRHASFIDRNYFVYTNDNGRMLFSINGEFYHTLYKNIQLPTYIVQYVQNSNPGEKILSNELYEFENTKVLYVYLLKKALSFSGANLNALNFASSSEYSQRIDLLPQNIVQKINKSFDNAIIKYYYVIYDGASKFYRIYLISKGQNIEYSIDDVMLSSTIKYIGMKISDIPDTVLKQLTKYQPNVKIKSASKSVSLEGTFYDISLLNNGFFNIKSDGTIRHSYFYVSPNQIAPTVLLKLEDFESKKISKTYFFIEENNEKKEFYYIEFDEGLIVQITTDGTFMYIYSRLWGDLPQKLKNFIATNFSINDFVDYLFVDANYDNIYDYYYFVYLTQNRVLAFNKNGDYLGMQKKSEMSILAEKQNYLKKQHKPNFEQ